MLSFFGCVIGDNHLSLDGSFDYPGYDHKVYFFPDPPHMLKLARNALAEYEVFVDGEGKEIQWNHIKDFHNLQLEQHGLRKIGCYFLRIGDLLGLPGFATVFFSVLLKNYFHNSTNLMYT